MTPKVFVVGGTGAQGMPVIRGLVKDKAYACRILTRDPNSPRARSLKELGNVELMEGTFANEGTLRAGFQGCDFAFVNIDGFNAGEKAEMFWAIRAYELALEEGIRFFIYGNLDYGYKKSDYQPKYRCGHYDGKGRIGDWILSQTHDNKDRMGAALFTTGPYIEMVLGIATPMSPSIEDGIVTWRVPLGSGAVPHVALDDCEAYVRWMFDNQIECSGMNLEVAIEHVHYADLAAAFTAVTGRPAQYIDTEMTDYWDRGGPSGSPDAPAGYNADPQDPATLSMRENFTGFWNLWAASGANAGIVRRDYALLDQIYPGRVKTVEEWLRRQEQKGLERGLGDLYDQAMNLQPTLKVIEDKRQGSI